MDDKFIMVKNALLECTNNLMPMARTMGSLAFTVMCHLAWLGQGRGEIDYTPALTMYRLPVQKVETLAKALYTLQVMGLITCNISLQGIGKKDIVTIDTTPYFDLEGGFERIPISIYNNYLHVIKDEGWTVYCILSRFHNNNLSFDGLVGCADVSEDYIGSLIGIHRQTVAKYLKLLEQEGLVKSVLGKNKLAGWKDKEMTEPVFSFDSKKYQVQHKATILAYKNP